jgi:hypothetical protein
MTERLTRTVTPPPQSERDALVRMGCEFEETEDEVVVTYPEGAYRETIDEREGRYAVFFLYHSEMRQVTELFNRFTNAYIMILRPARCR